MMSEPAMHAVIRGLYDGILAPDAWQQSLRMLSGMAGSAQASMLVRDTVQDRVTLGEVSNPVREIHERYEQEFQAIDPARGFASGLSVGNWYVDARDLGEGAMARHPFYQEFLRPFELRSYMACLVERQPHYEVYFSLQGTLSRPAFMQEDTRRLDWAMPHMRSAMRLRDRTLEVAALASMADAILERLAFGVIVYSAQRRVLMSNRIGDRWARRLDPSGKVSEWTLSRPFAAMLRAACDPTQPLGAQAALAADGAGNEAQVIVLPLSPSHRLASAWQQPAALVVVHERGGTPPLLADVLRGLYGLTPAETRLACELASGQGLPEAGARLGIRHETARSQVKAIFQKTGASSQPQLAHLLSQLAIALAQA